MSAKPLWTFNRPPFRAGDAGVMGWAVSFGDGVHSRQLAYRLTREEAERLAAALNATMMEQAALIEKTRG